LENASDRTLALVAARGAGTDEPAECPPLRTRGGEPDVPSSVRKDRHVPGTSGLSIRSFTAGVAGDTSASAPILACVWSFSAGAPSEAISPDAPDGCGSRTSSPEVHPPARGNPGATPALSPTEARARSRRLARGFLTPDPIKRRATKGSDWGGDSRASAARRQSAPFVWNAVSHFFSTHFRACFPKFACSRFRRRASKPRRRSRRVGSRFLQTVRDTPNAQDLTFTRVPHLARTL
jgi:hypothetical protein